MAKVFKHERPTGITLPHSRWHPDGTLIKLYLCLEEPDCNLPGTTFYTGYVKELYPVMLRSTARVLSTRERALFRNLPPGSLPVVGVNLFDSGHGKENGQFNFPRGIAVDSAGNILVSDSNNHRLQKFSPTGTFLNVIGKRGHGPGEFHEPGGIAVDSGGNIYVADVANRRIQKLKPDGTFVADWKGPEPGFYGPRDLSVGPDNSVYVVDQGHSRIVKFDPSGKVLAVWGTPGTGNGQFKEPTAIAVGGKNERVYVADPRNKRIAVFDPNGAFIASWPVKEWGTPTGWYFQDLAIDSTSGLLYASSNATDHVLVFDMNGNKLKSVDADPPEKVRGASAIALVKNNLYVVNTFAARVNRIELETR
jgi:DNA-binding beta-propeller fold protein YncE